MAVGLDAESRRSMNTSGEEQRENGVGEQRLLVDIIVPSLFEDLGSDPKRMDGQDNE